MAIYQGNIEKHIFGGSVRKKHAYLGSAMKYQYDSVAPNLTVSAPAGTSSGSPTYVTAASYTVSGTVSDADSGVAAVYVNGSAATISGNNWSKSVSLSANTSTKIEVYAVDNAGNQSDTITRYVCYDNAVPSLAVAAPTGTSSSSPTYVQSDSAYSYTVSGTVSDASGIKSVTVNGQAATISGNTWSRTVSLATNTTHTINVYAIDNAGNRTATITRYVRIEAYYQQAARTAGTTVQSSLDATLKNSTVCNAIAGNSTAYGIMKSKYSSNITSAIGSNWNDGLNKLAYKCKLKCYIIRNRVGVSGLNSTTNGMAISCNSEWGDNEIYGVSTNTQIDLSGYTKGYVDGWSWSGYGTGSVKIGFTKHPQTSLSNSSIRHLDLWGWNNACVNITNADDGGAGVTFSNKSFTLNSSYRYVFIALDLPSINGYSMNGQARIDNLIITP